MENSEPLYSYSNQDALNDGTFVDVTPDSRKQQGWQWIVTASVQTQFSLAAIAELFNEMATHYNQTKELSTTGKMNNQELCLMLEAEEGKKIFKICFPDEL